MSLITKAYNTHAIRVSGLEEIWDKAGKTTKKKVTKTSQIWQEPKIFKE